MNVTQEMNGPLGSGSSDGLLWGRETHITNP